MTGIDYSGLPESLQGGMRRYFEHGIEPGSFLMAVLENDLMEAFYRADISNREQMYSIAFWLYNEAPEGAFGSRELCQAHMKAKRLQPEATR